MALLLGMAVDSPCSILPQDVGRVVRHVQLGTRWKIFDANERYVLLRSSFGGVLREENPTPVFTFA